MGKLWIIFLFPRTSSGNLETTATCAYDGDNFWAITQYRKYELTIQVDLFHFSFFFSINNGMVKMIHDNDNDNDDVKFMTKTVMLMLILSVTILMKIMSITILHT